MIRIARRRRQHRSEAGYMLLILMLAVAVISLTLLGAARNYRRMLLRDREVEMIHRGAQYARAVRKFYKANNGRYPTSLEELENFNKVRYLRKRYKDPMTKDGKWQLAHITDINLNNIGGLKSTVTASSGPAQNVNPALSGDFSAAGSAAAQAQAAADAQAAAQAAAQSANANNPGGNSSGSSSASGTNPATSTADSGSSNGGVLGSNPATSGNVLGGGPVLGVISKSKAEGIHVFNEKKKHNEWYFIYDPSQEPLLPQGPYNPSLNAMGSTGLGAGNPASQGQQGTQSTPQQPQLNGLGVPIQTPQ